MIEIEGIIASCGFASGDRVVVGSWSRSPLGAFTDVMWAEPDGRRRLLAPTGAVADFVTGIYDFEVVDVVEVVDRSGPGWLRVTAGDRMIAMDAGRGVPFLVRRPRWVTQRIEAPIARHLLHVETAGTSPRGIREWYQADRWRPVRQAWASVAGRDLGAIADLTPALRVGFSEPPRRPSLVELRTLIDLPSLPHQQRP